ncbi:hypothetical protein SAMN02910298_01694 [Pseudobutyrivibrio sp. YE44]|uniref:DUF5979 domain-containing protein n=1 Tax=Pseudobutyrivibrio sp. YE44 TaxID=1520802 RepID=UPI000883B6E4|nr:DUF5979 domain-containing protein [Pseudobutyrivibrio sp. YE44]SDB34718.1 hypothetical protein SAMN02910298_01694 [Pseudobutyrivibrio sp. YE44]
MIKANLSKKTIIGVALAAVLALGGFSVQSLRAAERVDTAATVTITANIDSNDTSVFASRYKDSWNADSIVEMDPVTVDLYKIASLEETGTLSPDSRFSNIPVGELLKSPNADTIIEKIVTPAKEIAEGLSPDKTIAFENGSLSATATIPGGAGLYLYIPKAKDNRYSYNFISYVILAPNSDYTDTTGTSDKWNYNVGFSLKGTEEQRTGSLLIKKKLESYNISLGDVSFVYRVKGQLDDQIIDNVYTIDFTGPDQESRLITGLPATAKVTVTEEYAGVSYKPVEGSQTVYTDVEIVADDGDEEPVIPPATVDFKNTYDDGLISSGIAAENQFIDDGNGEVHFDGRKPFESENVR